MTDFWDQAESIWKEENYDLDRARQRAEAGLKDPRSREDLIEMGQVTVRFLGWDDDLGREELFEAGMVGVLFTLEHFWKGLTDSPEAMHDTVRTWRERADTQLRAMGGDSTEPEPRAPAPGLPGSGASDAARGNVLRWPGTKNAHDGMAADSDSRGTPDRGSTVLRRGDDGA